MPRAETAARSHRRGGCGSSRKYGGSTETWRAAGDEVGGSGQRKDALGEPVRLEEPDVKKGPARGPYCIRPGETRVSGVSRTIQAQEGFTRPICTETASGNQGVPQGVQPPPPPPHLLPPATKSISSRVSTRMNYSKIIFEDLTIVPPAGSSTSRARRPLATR